MKLRMLIITMLSITLAFVPMAAVVAQGDDSTETSESTEPTAETETEGEDSGEDEEQSTREERRAERLQKMQEKLDEVRVSRAEGRCTGAQNKLENTIKRVEIVRDNRSNIYDKISSKANDVVDRLEAAGVDTTELATEVEELDTMINEFFSVYDGFLLALEDASELDCVEDPEGFLLALEDAKNTLKQLKDKAGSIGEYVRGTILATLQVIKEELKPGNGEQGEDEPVEEEEENEESNNEEEGSDETTTEEL